MPRFVILEHEQENGVHYDLMLEAQNSLWTWSFHAFPKPGMTCVRLADHRTEYLDYEGEISGGRGAVRRVGAGTFDMMNFEPDHVYVYLRGDTLRGNCRLVHGEGDGDDDVWRFECE